MSLTVRERLQALLDGKKIRISGWRKGSCILLPFELPLNQELSYFLLKEDKDWEIMEEPMIELTSEDVGRKVRHNDGSYSIITRMNNKGKDFLCGTNLWFDTNGIYSNNDTDYNVCEIYRD